MKTKLVIKLSLSVFTALGADLAFAGTKDGGGGGAIVCPRGESFSARLIDIEEMLQDGGRLNAELEGKTWLQQVELITSVMKRFSPQVGANISDNVDVILSQLDRINLSSGDETVFPAPQDLSSGRLPRIKIGCAIYGVAIFNDEAFSLSLSTYLWKLLPETHKAALVIHEALYRMQRELHAQAQRVEPMNSAIVRKIVGYYFSEEATFGRDVITQQRAEAFNQRTGLIDLDGRYPGMPPLGALEWSTIAGTNEEVYRSSDCKQLKIEVIPAEKAAAELRCDFTAMAHGTYGIDSEVVRYIRWSQPRTLKVTSTKRNSYAIELSEDSHLDLHVQCVGQMQKPPDIHVRCESNPDFSVPMHINDRGVGGLTLLKQDAYPGFDKPYKKSNQP